MESFVSTVLGYLLSGFNFITQIANWCWDQPLAAAFWGSVFFSILNWIVKRTETKIDDSLLDILTRAIQDGVSKIVGLKPPK